MYKTLSAPLVAQVEISANCTNRCLHCYNFWREDKKLIFSDNLSLDAIEIVMDKLISAKVFHIVFTGGEPLLNKRVLFRAIEKAKTANITIGINSNLIPLTFKDAEHLKELGVISVLTSLMASTADAHDEFAQFKGAFKGTVRGIKFLQKVGIPVMVNMVISQKNKHFLRETALFVKSLGINHFNSTRAGCPGNCNDFSEMSLNLQDFRDYLEELYNIGQQEQIITGVLESYPLCAIKEVRRYSAFTGHHCLAGVTTLTVATDGNVRPCSHLDVSYGNIFNENLIDIWNRMKKWRDGSFLPSVCRFCKLLSRCGGGCRMEAKMRKGSLMAPDPYIRTEDIDYIINQYLSKTSKTILPLPFNFRLNSKIRWRLEEFGAVVFLGSKFVCYLNKIAVALLQSFNRNKDYQLKDFSGYDKENLEKFLTEIYNKRVLVSVDS